MPKEPALALMRRILRALWFADKYAEIVDGKGRYKQKAEYRIDRLCPNQVKNDQPLRYGAQRHKYIAEEYKIKNGLKYFSHQWLG